jgi:hypothetical protein
MFKDANGTEWHLEIKIKHVEAIRQNCKWGDGKPVDLLAILERGQLDRLIDDIETLVNVVFVVCFPQAMKLFDLAAYDAEMRWEYEMFPEMKTESEKIKASRWFGGLMNGQALLDLKKAFQEELVNFFPNETKKERLKKLVKKSEELERIQTEELLQQIDEAAKETETMIRSETKKRMQEFISDVRSGNVPESLESIPFRTASES